MALSPITPIERLPASVPTYSTEQTQPTGHDVFGRILDQVLGTAGSADKQANLALEALATGEADDLHSAALAVAQADLSFRLALSIRNRVLDAYQEVMRIQV